jgi:hypothetical protein
MSIVDKIEAFVNETKEMTLKKVEKKIKDGYWEAEQDLKVGKHAMVRDLKTNKRMTIYITEDLDEATGLKFTKKDKSSWEKQAKTMGLIIKPATDSEGESNKLWNAKDKQGNIKGEFHLDKGGFLKEDLDEGFKVKTGLQGALSINGKSIAKIEKVGNNVFVMIDKEDGDKNRIAVPGGKDMMASEIAEWLEEYLKKNPKALTESSYEKDLDPKKKIVVKGVKGMKSKPFTKKFRNMDAFDKWQDTDEAGDYEIHQVMNEDFDESELEDLDEATKSIDIPADVYRASLGHDPKKWKKWYTDNGFSVDSKTNRLSRDNNLWKIDTSTKSLIVMNESELEQINEVESDPYNFISDLIFDFEKKLMMFVPITKNLDPEVRKDLKRLEAECAKVRKGKLHDIRSGR